MLLTQIANGDKIQNQLSKMTGSRTVPSVWVGGKFFGGSDATVAAFENGKMQELLKQNNIEYQTKERSKHEL